MQVIYWVLIVVTLAGLLLTVMFSLKTYHQPDKLMNEVPLRVENNHFVVEIAETEKQRNRGLMMRDQLPMDRGMLFVFERSGIYPFWMMNTRVPLDIIWINEDRKIAYIYKNARPCESSLEAICKSIIPEATAKYVLEVNSGLVDKLDINIGDSVQW